VRAVNLIPENQRERRTGFANRSHGVVYVVLGVIALLALMVGLYGKARHEVSKKEAEVTRYEAEAAHVQAQATSLAPYKTFVAMRESRETAVRELVDTRFDWAHTLAEFGRVLPPGTSVTALEGCVSPPTKSGSSGEGCASSSGGGSSASSKSASVTSATPAGSIPKFTIAGCATSQSEVARMLSDLRLMDGVATAELQSAAKSGGGGSGGGGTCQGKLVSFGAKVEFQPIPSPPSGSSSGSSSSSSSKAVPASTSSGGGSSTGAPE
jgi:Tfp pilus assembly protein PilN